MKDNYVTVSRTRAIIWSNIFHNKTEISKYFRKVIAFYHSFIILNSSIQTQQTGKTFPINYVQLGMKVPFSPTKATVMCKPKYHEFPCRELASILLKKW